MGPLFPELGSIPHPPHWKAKSSPRDHQESPQEEDGSFCFRKSQLRRPHCVKHVGAGARVPLGAQGVLEPRASHMLCVGLQEVGVVSSLQMRKLKFRFESCPRSASSHVSVLDSVKPSAACQSSLHGGAAPGSCLPMLLTADPAGKSSLCDLKISKRQCGRVERELDPRLAPDDLATLGKLLPREANDNPR